MLGLLRALLVAFVKTCTYDVRCSREGVGGSVLGLLRAL